MKKTLIISGLVLVAAVVLLFTVGMTAPPEDAVRAGITGNVINTQTLAESEVQGDIVPINTETSMFEFEGYGPGKSHVGVFEEFSGNLLYNNGQIVGVEGTIQADSVNTGIGGLDSHLKNEDFFHVEMYPEIQFSSTNIDTQAGQATGPLTFLGVTKEITFPVEVTDNSISTDFILDTTPFGMQHTGTDKEVRIAFEFSI